MMESTPGSQPLQRHNRVSVRVDAASRRQLRRIWRYVGYDEPNYTYMPDGRALLLKLGSLSDGPYFIRAHYMLCSGDGTARPKWGSTNVYTEGPDGVPVYSWAILDRILDTLLDIGCVPFVELGFMPEALSVAPAGTPYDDLRQGGWRYPPRDYPRWQGLIQALARHCLERYGLREVSRWYWELWNEPDIFYWAGTADEYCRLYDHTVAGLLSVLPQARVGGPATTNPPRPEAGAFLRAFLEHCVRGTNAATGEIGTRLDFLSFHTKGGGYRPDPAAAKSTPTIAALVRNVAVGLEIASQFPELAKKEVILSECDPDGWAAGSRHDNPNLFYRNTEYYASYVANAVCKLLDLASGPDYRVDGMLTWAFEFEGREYFEGLRTLSTNGVDKPVLNVFRALARLGGQRLHLESDAARDPLASESGDVATDPPDVSGIAAIDGTGGVQVFLCSHHDDWDVATQSDVRLEVAGLAEGRAYRVLRYLIDADHSNAHTVWQRLGQPQSPSSEQLGAMRAAARLESAEEAALIATGGRLDLSITLAAHAICLLELEPV
jgi:xylan 1,4-beta-xylosidase